MHVSQRQDFDLYTVNLVKLPVQDVISVQMQKSSFRVEALEVCFYHLVWTVTPTWDLSLVLKQCALSARHETSFSAWCSLARCITNGDSVPLSCYAVSCNLSSSFTSLILSGEYSPLQNALTAPYACRCHGKDLPASVDYSYCCPQARMVTSRRQEMHIQGQFLPPGKVLAQQMLSYRRDY